LAKRNVTRTPGEKTSAVAAGHHAETTVGIVGDQHVPLLAPEHENGRLTGAMFGEVFRCVREVLDPE
jgi:hypothetical protein